MGKGSNLQKKQAARARHEKDAQKPRGGGGQAGKASRTGALAPKVICQICRVDFESDDNCVDRVLGVAERCSAEGTPGEQASYPDVCRLFP